MRKHYLDNIRWITVLLVAIYHVIFMYNGISTALTLEPFHPRQLQDGFLYLVYPWFMILLFVVSGMASRFYLGSHTVKQFLSSRTRKLLVPSTLGLLVIYWILGFFSMSINGAFETMPVDTIPKPVMFLIMAASGIGPLWFIQALWLFSLVLGLVRKCEKKGKLFALCERVNLPVALLLMIPLWGAAQILNTPVVTVYRMGVYSLSFFLGYFVFAHEAVVERLSKNWILLTAAAAVLGIGYVIFYYGGDPWVDPVVNGPFTICYAWVAVLAILAVMHRFGNWDTPFTRLMNRWSFGIYAFHHMCLSGAAYLMGSSLPGWLSYCILGVAALGGSILLYEVISRIPVLRFCALGMKKEKKDVR